MLSFDELQYLLDLAQRVAKSSLPIVEKDRSAMKRVEQDLRRDVKIVADRELDAHITRQLRKESVFPILSEEKGVVTSKKKSQEYRWIVDPLDGSLNFSRGLPFCCISIGLWKEMDPLLGVVYDFNRDEIFAGIVGKGAWVNGKPIKVSEVTEKSKAVLCTGLPADSDFTKESLRGFVKSARRFKKARLLGSAALSLAYVSCGRADFYEENNIRIWDVAAGLALVKAAGGAINVRRTMKENNLLVRASNNILDAEQ